MMPVRRRPWMLLIITTALFLLATSRVHAQSSGPNVDECQSGTVDSTNSIEQTACIYGDQSGLDLYVETDDDEYEDWGGGDFYVPDVGSEAQVYDGSTLTYDTGMTYWGTSVTASGSLVPPLNDWLTLEGLYSECYDGTGDGWSCSWENATIGLAVSVQVTSPTATLSVSASPTPSTPGQSVTFTASISSGCAGTITFYDGGTSIGTGTISGTTATISTSSLTMGDHVITASWPGNSSYGPVTSSPITQVVYQTGPIQLPTGTNINTLAGNGSAGFYGDGGPALISELYYPTGVAVDLSGNIYIADNSNHRIRMINASTGNISTVAGNGTAGYSGDGGAATSATLYAPEGVAVDSSGNIYIADLGNSRIREVVASTGIITTVAGNGASGYSGDGGIATSAEMDEPCNVTLDIYGNLYIADYANCRIRKVTRATSDISTVAGTTCGFSGDGGSAVSAQLYFPTDVSVDSSGNLYIVDSQNGRIRKVTASTGNISTVAGNGTAGYSGDGGAATSAALYSPFAVVIDSSGDLFISDSYNFRVREVNASSGIINTIAGNGTGGYAGDGGVATSAELDYPFGLALDTSGNVYIADVYNQRIRVVGTSKTTPVLTIATSATPAASGALVTFTAVVSTAGGTAPTGNVTFNADGTVIGAGSITSVSTTNLVPFSSDFSSWNTIEAQVTTTSAIAPDGSNTAALITVGPFYYIGQAGFACSPGPVTHSVWLKQNDANPDTYVWLSVRFYNSQGSQLVLTGSVFAPTSNWQRFSETYTAPAGTTSCWIGIEQINSNFGAATSGSVYAWGAQVEQASSPGPYVMTGSSPQSGSGGIATFGTNLLIAGTHSITASWPGDANYRTATSGSITQTIVAQANPVISWSTPSAISYGTALSGTQLNATASVAGTFVYTPEAGAILDPGSQELSVTFYPTDNSDYSTVTSTVTLQVNNSGSPSVTQIYGYNITNYAANSDIQAYTDLVNGTWGSIGYDSLNRLTGAQGTAGYYSGLQVNWGYDSFGNRTSQSFSGSSSAPLPSSSSASYNANNQVSASSLMSGGPLGYDGSGDVTLDNTNQYLYDGEGRVCAVKDLYTGAMTEYIYDAEGARVAKGTITSWGSCDTTANGFSVTNSYALGPGNEQLTEMAVSSGTMQWSHTNVYGAGMLLATYDADPNSGTQALHFQLSDWQGTRRVQTDYAGNIEETCTSLPFGDALSCNIPSGAPSTADDATEHHFTGKERDTESGLDYFGARYDSSTMGRFLTPDWSATVEPVPYAKMADPQSLNLYSYVQNNPLASVDTDGHQMIAGINPALEGVFSNSEAEEQQEALEKAQQPAQQQNNTTGYTTQDAAAKAVLSGLNPKSIKENTEYAGLIYKDSNGLFHYTNPNGGNGDSSPVGSIPKGTTEYGDYHTHGDYATPGPDGKPVRTDAAHDRYNSDHFSSVDKQQNRDSARSNPAFRGYLGTPSGALLIYNPITNREGPLQ